jgi:hypothetical protein
MSKPIRRNVHTSEKEVSVLSIPSIETDADYDNTVIEDTNRAGNDLGAKYIRV